VPMSSMRRTLSAFAWLLERRLFELGWDATFDGEIIGIIESGLFVRFGEVFEVPVDIETEIEIDRPRSEVAAYASDPDNATSWYENSKAIESESPKPVAVGSRVAFVAQFLGRRLAYTYEVKLIVPGERFAMRNRRGPVPDGDDV
jgi:hypothetical protein